MGQITKEFAENLLSRIKDGRHIDTTLWEEEQLVRAWLKVHSGGGEADAESKRMKWLEDQSTLHHRVEILYVVDGYEVQVLHEDGVTEMSPVFHGPTLAAAIDNALSYVEDAKE